MGILSAPKPGKEIRKDIKDKSEEFVEKGKSKFEKVKGKGKEIIKKGKELKEVIAPKKEERKENTEA